MRLLASSYLVGVGIMLYLASRLDKGDQTTSRVGLVISVGIFIAVAILL